MIDYHLHTSRCCHATGFLQDYLRQAELKSLREVGFADHFPLELLNFTPRSQVTMNAEELPLYIRQVEDLKNSTTMVEVKLGVEIDYLPGTEKLVARLLEEYDFDFVIGSIHFLDDWDFTHPVYAEDYKKQNMDELYKSYYKLLCQACDSELFDIIGHLDVIKKFGFKPEGSLEPYWEETVHILKETGTCIELNTAGYDAPVGEFYPERRMLEICRGADIPITTGSDAHAPDQVGRYFGDAEALLKEVGYRELTTFNKRKRSTIPL